MPGPIFSQFSMFLLLLLYGKWLKSKCKHPNLSKGNSLQFFGVCHILLLIYFNVQMLCLWSSTDWVQNKDDIAIKNLTTYFTHRCWKAAILFFNQISLEKKEWKNTQAQQ